MRKSFFTAASFGGMAGATTATLLICNVTQHATGWFCRPYALGVAIAVSIAMVFLFQEVKEKVAQTLYLAVMNGLLVYFSAFGVQNAFVSVTPQFTTTASSKRVMVEPPQLRLVETQPVPGIPSITRFHDPEDVGHEGPETGPAALVEMPAVFETRETIIVAPEAGTRSFRTAW